MYDGLQNTELNPQGTRNAGGRSFTSQDDGLQHTQLNPQETTNAGTGPSPARLTAMKELPDDG